MRVLITGLTGFVGSHLADYLVSRGDVEVYGTYRWRSRMDNVDHLRGRLQLVECDLREATWVRRVMAAVRPDRIFHLAAQSYVPTSWRGPPGAPPAHRCWHWHHVAAPLVAAPPA